MIGRLTEDPATPDTFATVKLGPVAPPALIINDKFRFPVPPALLALKTTLEVPAAVGVPDTSPEPVLIVKPLGRPVALKLVGLLVAVIW